MEEEKIIVERNGTTYEMKKKKKNLDDRLNIKISKEMLNDIRSIANQNDINYSLMIRSILEEFIKKYK